MRLPQRNNVRWLNGFPSQSPASGFERQSVQTAEYRIHALLEASEVKFPKLLLGSSKEPKAGYESRSVPFLGTNQSCARATVEFGSDGFLV